MCRECVEGCVGGAAGTSEFNTGRRRCVRGCVGSGLEGVSGVC